ncbi:MAG: hypothetical protein WKF73_21805 [Nocardioidaceae bacterium]
MPNASTVGPAPEITAATSAARSASTNPSELLIAGRRYSWWSRSSVAASSWSGTLRHRGHQQRCAARVQSCIAVRDHIGQQSSSDPGRQRVAEG